MSKKNNKSSFIIIIDIIIITVFAIVAIAASFLIFYKPSVTSDIPFDTTPIDTSSTGDDPYVPSGDDYVRTADVYNFLVLGKDRAASLTDVFFLAQFNVKNNSMNIVQVPRDTYAYHGTSYSKINGLYSHYLSLNENDTKKSIKDLADYLQKNMNIKIDHYVMINLDAFVKLVDLIGGVEINIPEDMKYSDPAQDLYIDLKKGKQVINGDQAEQFVRFRSGYLLADVGRMDAQKIFMSSFITQFKNKIKISMVDDLVNQFFENVTTDMNVADCIYFAKEALKLDMSKLQFLSLPGEDVREYGDHGQWYFVLNRKSMLAAVNGYLNLYEVDITDSIFDASRVFTNKDRDVFDRIYTAPEMELDVKIASQIMEDGIYIQRY